MKKSLMLMFPVEEYEDRLSRLIAGMERSGLDAVILTSDENTFYFGGFRSIVWDSKVSTPCVLVITADGDMAITTSKSGVETAGITSAVEDIRFYGPGSLYPSFAGAIVSLLAEKKLLDGRIGMEFTDGQKMHLNHAQREALFAELADGELVDASGPLWAVRRKKSAAEIAVMRRCCEINWRGIDAGLAAVREGMTEMELYRTIAIEYFRLGAERTLLLGVRAGEERYSQGNSPPSNRRIGKGEIILIDGGPIVDWYYSDIIREAVIGGATDRQRDMFAVARDACYAGIEKMKPGLRIGDACDAAERVIARSPYAEFSALNGWVGHSIGTGVHEFPMLISSEDTLFEPGMTFAIEPYFYQEKVGSLGIEENILITETGNENLTPSDSTLRVL